MIRFYTHDAADFLRQVALGALCCVCVALFSAPVRGENMPAPAVIKPGVLDLARRFMDTVGKKLEDARVKEETSQNPLSRIAEGEPLIFVFLVNEKIQLEGEILTIKKNNDLIVSFRDFLNVIEFPILLDAQSMSADGWYIKESNGFSLDWENRRVTASGRTYNMSRLAYPEGDDLMIPLPELEAWFGLTMKPSVENLVIVLTSEERLPIEDKLKRRNREIYGYLGESEAKHPLLDDPYQMAEIPVVDISSGLSYRRPAQTTIGGDPVTSYNSTLRAAGDMLKHTGNLFITGNKENIVNSARFTLSKTNADDVLLGPLKARRYELGDIAGTSMPLFSGGVQELGARITNRDNSGRTSYTTKTFTGNIPPGWDVELYQNDQLLSFLTVPEDGIYTFEDVTLFAGENNFRFVFYGPQGEIREDKVSVPVNLTELQGGGIYDVSVTAQDTSTYTSGDQDIVDQGTPSLSATYEQALSDRVVGLIGLRHRKINETAKTQFLTGLSTTVLTGLLTSNLGIDETGEMGLDTNLRRQFGAHDVSTGIYFGTDNFEPTGVNINPTVLSTQMNVKGPFFDLGNQSVDYSLFGSLSQDAEGESVTDLKQGFTTRFNRTRLSHELLYRQESTLGTERLESALSLSGYAWAGVRWRARAGYEYIPENNFTDLYFEANKNIGSELSLTGELSYRPDPEYYKGTLKANWQGEDGIISPQISMDSEDEFQALLSSRYGLIKNPRNKEIDFTRQSQTGVGAISAFVFLDANGDGIFNEGETPIEGARVDALQSNRFAETDANGNALIQGLPEDLRTDIMLNGYTLEDPYWVVGTEGKSIIPRAGHIPMIDFPIHNAGEMDGTIWFEKNGVKKPIKDISISLYDEQGKKVTTAQTAFDGFYLLTRVPPGKYYVAFDVNDMKAWGVSAPPPQQIIFGYEGTVLYGQDFILSADGRNKGVTGFTVSTNIDKLQERHPHIALPTLSENTAILNLGEYQSQLMMSLMLFKIQKQYPGILEDAEELVKSSESLPDLTTNKYTLRVFRKNMNSEDAYRRCRSLSARGVSCTVELLPKGLDAKMATAVKPKV